MKLDKTTTIHPDTSMFYAKTGLYIPPHRRPTCAKNKSKLAEDSSLGKKKEQSNIDKNDENSVITPQHAAGTTIVVDPKHLALSKEDLIMLCSERYIRLPPLSEYILLQPNANMPYTCLGFQGPVISRPIPSYKYPQRTNEWFELRKGRLTASKFAKALGLYESTTASILGMKTFANHDALTQVVRELALSPEESTETFSEIQKYHMAWGEQHENNAVHCYLHHHKQHIVEETGIWLLEEHTDNLPYNELKQVFADSKLQHHFDYISLIPKIGASPDGLIHYGQRSPKADSVLEIKAPTPFELCTDTKTVRWKENWQSKCKPYTHIPVYYIPQIQVQMLVTGIKKCEFFAWTVSGARKYTVHYNPEYCALMILMLTVLQDIVNSYKQAAMNGTSYVVPQEPFYTKYPKLYSRFVQLTHNMSEQTKKGFVDYSSCIRMQTK